MLKFAVLALFLIVTSASAEETTSKKGIAEWGRQMKTAIEGLAQDAKQALLDLANVRIFFIGFRTHISSIN